MRTVTVVVMGVSGVGKSTVAGALAARTGWELAEADLMHSAANRATMAAGRPLADADRWPWLRRIAAWVGQREAAGLGCVVTCSALRRRYRDVLRGGHPSVRFAHLVADREVIVRRLAGRRGHFMSPALLDSQLATLEPLEPDEPGAEVVATGGPDQTAARVWRALRLDVASRASDRPSG